MVFVEKWPFFQFFFIGTIGQENVFYVILKRDNTFLGYKNKKFKKSKNWHFSKWDNPWFLVLKWPSFQNFFLAGIGQENVFYDILNRKKTFLGYKNKKFKKSKYWHFPKGDNPWFLVQIWPLFQHFFLGNIGQKNIFYDNLRTKNRLSRL